MMYWGNHMSTWGWILSIFGMLIILALIVGTLALLLSDLGSHGSSPSSPISAREILDRRLVNEEITPEQYDQLREKLAATSASSDPPATSAAGARG
jgi:uncharacterized membrane protein